MTDEIHKSTDASFRQVEKVEEFLIGLLYFGQKLLHTLFDLAFRQTKFSNTFKGDVDKDKYTKPITFITLTSFLAIRIFRFGLLTMFIAISVPSCSRETYMEVAYPSLWDELKVPTFTEIVQYGIPTLVVVLVLSRILKILLLSGSDKTQKTLLSITYYSVGFQFLAYLVVFTLLYIIFQIDWAEDFAFVEDLTIVTI